MFYTLNMSFRLIYGAINCLPVRPPFPGSELCTAGGMVEPPPVCCRTHNRICSTCSRRLPWPLNSHTTVLRSNGCAVGRLRTALRGSGDHLRILYPVRAMRAMRQCRENVQLCRISAPSISTKSPSTPTDTHNFPVN